MAMDGLGLVERGRKASGSIAHTIITVSYGVLAVRFRLGRVTTHPLVPRPSGVVVVVVVVVQRSSKSSGSQSGSIASWWWPRSAAC